MRILLVADLRSPIAESWASRVASIHEVHVLASYPLAATTAAAVSRTVVPLAFAGPPTTPGAAGGSPVARAVRAAAGRPQTMRWASNLRTLVAPLEVLRHRDAVREVVAGFTPDVVHALRLPYEAVATAAALHGGSYPPFAVSIWGNDLTLHAGKNPLMGRATRRALQAAAGLHSDCLRDQTLARSWGWSGSGPTLVVPGSGGLDTDQFHPGQSSLRTGNVIGLDVPAVLNPRGNREYVRNDMYLAALPRILQAVPDVQFLNIGGAPRSASADVRGRLLPLGTLTPDEMADVYRAATVSVSPSLHDGTPNTLLEAMATGVLPVVHPVSSVLEWIEHGVNGLLIDANDPRSIADGVIRGLLDHELRAAASRMNRELVMERASAPACLPLIRSFYERVADS